MSTYVPTPKPSPTEEQKAARRQEMIQGWRQLIAEWDFFPIQERLKNEPDTKLGNRRALMEAAYPQPDWFRELSAAQIWVEEYCFEEAMRQVLSEYGIAPRVDGHAFWVSEADAPTPLVETQE
jgi:hypothetical protein